MAKAEAAQQKAECATDALSYEQAWREAARQWERAADRETDDKRRKTYGEKAEAARASADGPRPEGDEMRGSTGAEVGGATSRSKLLN